MKIIGHRGAAGLAPENTLPSIQKALDCGVDSVEFDLRVTKDGVVVLHHDAEIVGLDEQLKTIGQLTYDELKHLRPNLTSFEELIAAYAHKTALLAEIKPGEQVEPIVAIIKSKRPPQLSICSFSPQILAEIQGKLPDTKLVVNEYWSGIRATYRARKLGTRHISINQKWLWRGFVKRMTGRGWCISTYTLNDPQKALRWSKAGLYAVITNFPDRFQKL